MSKKILIIAVTAIVLVAILAALAVFAPGSRNDTDDPAGTTTAPAGETTPSGEDTTTGIDSGIPSSVNFGNRDITFFIWSDHTMKEFYADDVTGNPISDEIHDRNLAVEDALGIKLKYIEEPGADKKMTEFVKKVETDLNSGACTYDIIAGYSRSAPALALTGRLIDLTTTEYIDLEHPWWPSTLVDECTVNNQLYFCSGDISTNLLWMMSGTFFNKELITQYNLENPYDLVKNNKWTIDKMMEMSENRYIDLDAGGTADESDAYGVVLYDINLDSFFNAAGFTALRKDNNGEIVISSDMSDQRLYDLIDKLGSFVNSPDVYHSGATSVRNIFFEQRALFTTDRCFIVAGKDNSTNNDKIEFEYGLVPQPKLTTSQDSFYTTVGHPFTMYAISIGVTGDDIDACSATLEMMAYESYKRITPVVFEEAMKVKYSSDEITSEMYDILRGTVVFDLGRLYSTQIGDVYKTVRTQILNNSKTFASQYKVISKMMESGIKTISSAFND